MSDSTAPVPTYDSKKEGEQSSASLVKMWVDALHRADAEEKDWRKEAEKAIETYRGKKEDSRAFNILHSNIETICPALYNSTPSPDVRRRFSDPDPTAKVVADIIERSLSFTVDNYDFDSLIKTVIRDGELTGRGVPRVRYLPVFGDAVVDGDGQPVNDESGNPVQEVTYETVQCDYVPWRYFRRGPGRQWKDVPWVAFGDFLSKDDIRKINPQIADELNYNYSAGSGEKKPGAEEESIFKRCLVWQIWDKEMRRVISISTEYTDAPISIQPDPLGLTDFFPIPRPYSPIQAPDSLTPVVPYSVYEELAEELNIVSLRIKRLVRQLRPRGIYGGRDAADIQAWAQADDGELIPATSADVLSGQATMQNLVAWFPLEATVQALQALVMQREQIKQTIYEVTGLGDILRGASKSSETATAQSIKAQWGSLRIQDRQGEVARLVRDLFRIKAEIIATKFSWDTLAQMTGIVVPSNADRDAARAQVQQFMQAQQQAQAAGQPAPPVPPNGDQIKKAAEGPSREEVEQVLRSDILRAYRIDVESDSTIRGDLSRNQQNMSQFLQGTAQFASSMGPIIQEAPAALPVVMEIYSAFARQFKLGKQAEDALDSIADLTRSAGKAPPKQDPKVQAQQARAQADMAQTQMDMQKAQADHAMEMQKMQAEAQLDAAKLETEHQRTILQQQKAYAQLQVQQTKHQMQMQPFQYPPPTVNGPM